MDSQTSADDIINEFDRSCSCSTLSDTTFGVSTGCCAKDIVEKLMVQLKEKDEQFKENIKVLKAEIMHELKDEFAKMLSTQSEQHQKQMEKLEEIEKKLALKSVEEKYQKEIGQLKGKCQKENAELEANKNWERNANFAKEQEMANLKEQPKDKTNWNQVDLVMGKKLPIPINNRWNSAKAKDGIFISTDGLTATKDSNADGWRSVFAEKAFICADFPGSLFYYFEVTNMPQPQPHWLSIGFSTGNIPDYVGCWQGTIVGDWPNSYSNRAGKDHYWHSGKTYDFEWPNGAIKPKRHGTKANVMGCGLLLNFGKYLSIFFTLNGILLGKQILINPKVNALYPTVSLYGNISIEANFGDDLAKPFKYDIEKCPGLE